LPSVKNLTVLRRRAEFLSIAQSGKKWVTPGFIIQCCATPLAEQKSIIRYGLTASGKVGNAVKRNRAKRRLRALANELMPLHAVPDHDYVLIARTTTVARDFADLKKDLLWALKKLGVYHEASV
jgi:ribonuclease P protein component